MIRITQQSSAEAARHYYSSADYYTEGQELVGEWGGRAAERLGLSGTVSKDSFDSLCENRHPTTGERLTPRTKSNRTVGYDLTFDPPKSVSVLYALTRDEGILDAFRASVRETMTEIEQDMQARVRGRGQDENRRTGNMAWAEFIHFTARPVDGIPDPQLHAHNFVFNATWDSEEQRFKAGQFQDIHRDAPYYQAAFHARLADRLTDLGFGIARDGKEWELAGVPAEVIAKYSRRDAQIEAEAKKRGITDPAEKSKLAAKTREHKAKNLTWEELRQEWDGRLTAAERGALADVYARRSGSPGHSPAISPAAAVDYAILHCFERSSVVSERQLLAEALTHGVGAVSVEQVQRELANRPLIVRELQGRRLATTREVLNEESCMLAFARSGRGRHERLGNPQRPFRRDWLNAGQRAAVRHVLSSRDRVIMVRGAAGTGKTSMMQEAVEAIGEGGKDVVVLAPSAQASRDVLRKEGFAEADTVARFLVDEKLQEQARGQVLWVDEAGLLGVPTMAKLFDAAERLGARVILSGDRRQHASVERGPALRLLEQRAGVPSVEITDIQRQRGDYKRAVQYLSEGKAAEGFDELDRLGWIKEVPLQERYRLLAADYLKAAAERKKNGEQKTALVVSPTHAEGDRITATIRAELHAKGKLKEERALSIWTPAHLTEAQRADVRNYRPGDMLQFHQNAPGYRRGRRVIVRDQLLPLPHAARFQVYRPGTIAVAVGERLRVTANGETRDGKHRLDNGTIITVKGFTDRGDLVDERGWVIARDFGHLTHGYVVTSHAAQGKTVDRVLIGQSSTSFPASGREQFYVSASRGREAVTIYTDDRQALRKAIHRGDERLSATELVGPPEELPRDRLRLHQAFLRRLAAFERTHATPAERGREPAHQREMSYER